jgi:hypothetical protein
MEINLCLNIEPVRAVFLQSAIPSAMLAATFVSAERHVGLCFQAEGYQYSVTQLPQFLTTFRANRDL